MVTVAQPNTSSTRAVGSARKRWQVAGQQTRRLGVVVPDAIRKTYFISISHKRLTNYSLDQTPRSGHI
jgi:hypothetical protein